MLTINRHPSRAQLWWFAGLWLPLFGGVTGSTLLWRAHAPAAAAAVWSTTALATLISLWSGRAARRVFLALSYATFPLGFVAGWTALAILYFVVLTPIALVMRLIGRDALRLETDAADAAEARTASHWTARPGRGSDADRAFRQF